MVGRILCFSVVANMKIACAGGSSRVFKNALNACEDSMCTSSMIYTLYFPICGGICTWSIRALMSSTPLLEAASSSCMQYDLPSWNEMHDSHWPQGSMSADGCSQLMVLAKILAALVFPTPLGPQKRYACASFPLTMEFFRVRAMLSCPISPSKDVGRYFRAETMY